MSMLGIGVAESFNRNGSGAFVTPGRAVLLCDIGHWRVQRLAFGVEGCKTQAFQQERLPKASNNVLYLRIIHQRRERVTQHLIGGAGARYIRVGNRMP